MQIITTSIIHTYYVFVFHGNYIDKLRLDFDHI